MKLSAREFRVLGNTGSKQQLRFKMKQSTKQKVRTSLFRERYNFIVTKEKGGTTRCTEEICRIVKRLIRRKSEWEGLGESSSPTGPPALTSLFLSLSKNKQHVSSCFSSSFFLPFSHLFQRSFFFFQLFPFQNDSSKKYNTLKEKNGASLCNSIEQCLNTSVPFFRRKQNKSFETACM